MRIQNLVQMGICVLLVAGLMLGLYEPLQADTEQTRLKLLLLDSDGEEVESTKANLDPDQEIKLVLRADSDLVSMYNIKGVLEYERLGVSPSQRYQNVFRDVKVTVSSGDNEEITPVAAIEQRGSGDGYNLAIGFKNAYGENVARTILSGEQIALIELTVNAEIADGITFNLTDAAMLVNSEGTEFRRLAVDGCSIDNIATRRELTLSMEESMTVPRDYDLMLPVRISSNTGFDDLVLQIRYDAENLVYKKTVLSPAFRSIADIQRLGQEELTEDEAPYTEAVGIEIYNRYRDIELTDSEMAYIYFEVKEKTADETTTVETLVSAVSNSLSTYMRGLSVEDAYRYSTELAFAEAIQPGDVNMDGEVSLIDAAYLLQSYHETRTLSDLQFKKGDVNCSGDISLVDVLIIMKRFNGAITDARWNSLTAGKK